MNKQKFESMWQMMRENNFELNENINSEYLCTICKKILIEACSAPCGCRYCKACITDYLTDEGKTCPGQSEYCKDEVISIDCDIFIDQTISTRISRLIIKCPNMNCQTKVDMKSMENHLKTCENQYSFCPFINVGCEHDILKSDKVNEHLLSEVHSHTKLLMGWVNISRNETELLKKDIEQLKSENYDLKIIVDLLNFGDFIWQLEGWTEKQKQAKSGTNQISYRKDIFTFKNGYKMCLLVFSDGFGSGKGTHLSIFYRIMKGPFDSILQWPFKHVVEISLMNQQTGLIHKTKTMKYSDKPNLIDCFKKPSSDRNIGYGEPKFIKLDDISSSPGVFENDQIVIKCSFKKLYNNRQNRLSRHSRHSRHSRRTIYNH